MRQVPDAWFARFLLDPDTGENPGLFYRRPTAWLQFVDARKLAQPDAMATRVCDRAATFCCRRLGCLPRQSKAVPEYCKQDKENSLVTRRRFLSTEGTSPIDTLETNPTVISISKVRTQASAVFSTCKDGLLLKLGIRTRAEGAKLVTHLVAGNLLTRHPCREFVLGDLQCILRVQACEQIEPTGDEPRPSGLVAGAEARAIVAVEILVKEDVVLPVRILLELLTPSVKRAAPILVPQENARKPPANLLGDFEQSQHIA